MSQSSQIFLYALPAAAFLLGSIPFAYIVARATAGIDIREHGSGNPGASNVFRVVGPAAGLTVFALDAGKAALALLLERWLFPEPAFAPGYWVWYELILGLFAVLGHVWSPFLGLQGGKGVAAFMGVFAVLFPLGLLAGIVAGIAAIAVFRYFSLGSLTGAAVLPVAYLLLEAEPWAPRNLPIFCLCLAAACVTYWRHLDNIKRLLRGEEHPLSRGDRGAPG